MAELGDQVRAATATIQPSNRRWIVRLVIGIALAASAVLAGNWLFSREDRPAKLELPDLASLNDDPDEPVVDRNPGYLGAAACAIRHGSMNS
jgi:hypothetical protein